MQEMSVMGETTVLVVEDEQGLRETYRAALESEYEVRTASDGEAALETVDDAVDIVFLDRRMPGLSGDEVLHEVRDRGVDCRVVMVTAVDPDTDLLQMDFDEYLVKPVETDRLRGAVERMLARDAMEDQVRKMFAVASKLATLESKLEISQQQRSERHQQLLEEFYALRDEVDLPSPEDDYYSESTLEKLQALLEATG
ncbi:MAG: response regulator [Haloarculaceae archaeon]